MKKKLDPETANLTGNTIEEGIKGKRNIGLGAR